MAIRERINKDFLYYFDQGLCLDAYKVFGSHLIKDENGKNIACEFCLYAPNAKRVEIVGEWNNFTMNQQELYCIDEKGIWYAKLEGDYEWQRYKYLITTKSNDKIYKADPYAFHAETPSKTASKTYDLDGYRWADKEYLKKRRGRKKSRRRSAA